jgi:hypothetical protein
MKHQRTESDYATSNPSNPDTMNDHIQVEMSCQESQLSDEWKSIQSYRLPRNRQKRPKSTTKTIFHHT